MDTEVLEVTEVPEVPPPVPALVEEEVTLEAALPMIPGADEFRSMAMQAKIFATSGLVPDALRNKPADTLLVLMTGRDLGIAPTAALRKCYVVDGQVTIAPALKLALVKIKGLGSIRPAPGNNDQSATAVAFDLAGNEIARYTVTWEEMARVEYAKGKLLVDKQNWRNYPARMLWWRAAGYLVDDVFPEVAFGIYTPDEVGALTDEDGHAIDVMEVPVPEGYERGGRAAPVTFVSEAEAEEMKLRANGLPGEARKVLKGMLTERGVAGFPYQLATSKQALVLGIIVALEKRAATGEWGPWSEDPADDWKSEAEAAADGPAGQDEVPMVPEPANPATVVQAMSKPDVKKALERRGLDGTGDVITLRARLLAALLEPVPEEPAEVSEVDALIERSMDPNLTTEERAVIADRLEVLEAEAEEQGVGF